jgi:putative ABC transport system permease protein
MLLNYLRLAFRLLVRIPFFSLLNIVGLATGFAAFLILWPYAQAEFKYDKFHTDFDQIARLGLISNGLTITSTGTNGTQPTRAPEAGCS